MTDSDHIDEHDDDELYENHVERQWSESSSIQGIDRDLLAARPSDLRAAQETREPAAFSPWLIPYAAIMAGPLVAALLSLLTDGDPPRARQAVAVFSIGAAAWVINFGLAMTETVLVSPAIDSSIRLGALAICGMVLWAVYTFWMKGKQALDQRALIHSAVVLVAVSAIFWMGRGSTWLVWLGR